MLDNYRDYLLLIANDEIDPSLQGKVGASDVVQQTFVQAVSNFGSFRGSCEAEFIRWLRQTLLNEMLLARRRFQRTDKRNVAMEVRLEDSAGTLLDDVARRGPTPIVRMAVVEELERLDSMVKQLPEDYQRVLRLRYWERKSFVEISREMCRTENASRKLWGRAIERLQCECARLQQSG